MKLPGLPGRPSDCAKICVQNQTHRIEHKEKPHSRIRNAIWERRLYEYAEGEISPALRKTVQSHIGACPYCRKQLSEIEKAQSETKNVLQNEDSVFDRIAAPAAQTTHLTAAVMEAVRNDSQKNALQKNNRHRTPAPLLIRRITALASVMLTAAAVIAVCVMVRGMPHIDDSDTMKTPKKAQTLLSFDDETNAFDIETISGGSGSMQMDSGDIGAGYPNTDTTAAPAAPAAPENGSLIDSASNQFSEREQTDFPDAVCEEEAVCEDAPAGNANAGSGDAESGGFNRDGFAAFTPPSIASPSTAPPSTYSEALPPCGTVCYIAPDSWNAARAILTDSANLAALCGFSDDEIAACSITASETGILFSPASLSDRVFSAFSDADIQTEIVQTDLFTEDDEAKQTVYFTMG